MRSLQVSAKVLGWKHQLISNINDKELAKLFGLDQKNRFNEKEKETPEMLMLITPHEFDNEINYSRLLDIFPSKFDSIANNIAQNYQNWPLISEIEDATFSFTNNLEKVNNTPIKRIPTLESKSVIMKRRSAQMMDKNNNKISLKEFKTLLNSTLENFNGFANTVNLVIFVHNIEKLKSGLYIFLRNKKYKDELVSFMNDSFLWEKIDENLYSLNYGDFRAISKNISCSQDIASNSAFALGMSSHFSDEILQNGKHRYKELYWKCGAIGQ